MDQDIWVQDLIVLQRMVSCLADYLLSEETHWSLREPGLPKMTIGGCLMRLQRLSELGDCLPVPSRVQLHELQQQMDSILAESVVRFESRTHAELHARLGEWVRYVAELSHHMVGDQEYYAVKVDTRVVIAAMVAKMKQSPYHLEEQVTTELSALDQNLRNRWLPGAFLWDGAWLPAYPQEEFWYLYGSPR